MTKTISKTIPQKSLIAPLDESTMEKKIRIQNNQR